jgi:hypothetical protein
MGRARTTLALAVVTAFCACAPDDAPKAQTEPPKNADPILGDRIVHALNFGGRLWLQGNGSLVSFRISGGDRKVAFSGGVVDVRVEGGELWVVRTAQGQASRYVVSISKGGAFADTAALTAKKDDEPFAVARDAGDPVVVTHDALFRYHDARWKPFPLKGQGRRVFFGNASVAEPQLGGDLYLGFNRGEWGGGLSRINLATGAVSEVGPCDPEAPQGCKLALAAATITDVIADPVRKDCVLAAEGLLHMGMSLGKVARVCGQRVELVFERPYQEPLPNGGGFDAETEAVFGIGAARDGSVWAATWKGVYRINGATVRAFPLPRMSQENGVFLSRAIPGVLLVRTDLNWAHSVSGYTTLLVPTE